MMISRAMGARKPGSQGERAISVKTIAQGMPDVLAEPVVTAACFLFCRRAMGCGQHPAFPAPSHLEEGDVRCKARTQMRRESVNVRFDGLRGRIFGGHHARKRVIQYAEAYRLQHRRLWNTGSPGQAGR
jgi:hypothetical protein